MVWNFNLDFFQRKEFLWAQKDFTFWFFHTAICEFQSELDDLNNEPQKSNDESKSFGYNANIQFQTSYIHCTPTSFTTLLLQS